MIKYKTTWWYTMTFGGQDCPRYSGEGLYLALWLQELGVPWITPCIHTSFHWLSVVLVPITAWIMCYCVVAKTDLAVSQYGLFWADQMTSETERVQMIELESSLLLVFSLNIKIKTHYLTCLSLMQPEVVMPSALLGHTDALLFCNSWFCTSHWPRA